MVAPRVAVVVPCATKHVPLLPSLIRELESQTRPPDEIIIAISGTTTPPRITSRIRIHALIERAPKNAGQNRNRGSAAVTGDFIVYQDADDVPHPQRIELTLAVLERSRAEHMMHGFVMESAGQPRWRAARYDVARALRLIRREARYRFDQGVTNGNPVVRRSLVERVRWPEDRRIGEDVAFNMRAATAARGTVILPLPLLLYRQRLSATS